VGLTLRDRVRRALRSLDLVEEGGGVFNVDEPGFFVNGRLVAEFSDTRTLGIRMTRALIRDHKPSLVADERIDPLKSGSDWIVFNFSRAADVARVVELVALAVPAYLPAPGEMIKPAPTGATLARLRRFH
jgi:hypothetical protein